MDSHDESTRPAGTGGDGDRLQAACCDGAGREERLREEASAGGSGRAGTWLAVGAVLAAVVSSACCWLPLLLIGLGVSAAGVAGSLERYRPLLLGVTGLLLAGGFYLTYARRRACAPGEACAARHRRLERVQKASLWIATLLVGAFALFPSYVTALLRCASETGAPVAAEEAGTREVVIRVRGMTCEGCASGIATRLRGVPGVARAEVDFEGGRARAWLRREADPAALLEAIEQLGYEAELDTSAAPRSRALPASRGGS